MRPQGKAFDSSCSMWDALVTLEEVAGSAWWIHEYQPVDYAERYLVEYLLCVLCEHDLCCAVGGPFGCYAAGVIGRSHLVPLFVAACDNVFLLDLFQTRSTPTFYIGPFTFTLVQRIHIHYLEFSYLVTLGDRSMTVRIIPVACSTGEIGPFSNLDFVHFLWRHVDSYNFLRRSIIAYPIYGRVRILYVQHPRARSDGWFTTDLCDNCPRDVRLAVSEPLGCSMRPTCKCGICVRQPPTLKAMAAQVVFDMVLNLGRFEVAQTTNFNDYLYAYMSGRVPPAQLVADYARCALRTHLYHSATERRYHRHCVSSMGSTVFLPASCTQFESSDNALISFLCERRRWWCFVCDRPLFECAPCHSRNTPDPDCGAAA